MGKQRDPLQFATHFWSLVSRGEPNECWTWKSHRSVRGYGQIGYRSPESGEQFSLTAHRVAYHLCNGVPPPGGVIMHTCDNPPCCNPAHLRLGTHQDNMRDRSIKGRTNRDTLRIHRVEHRGVACKHARLTEEDVHRIRYLCDNRLMKQRDIAKEYGLTQGSVMMISTRRNWKHLPERAPQ